MILHPITREIATVHLKQFFRKPIVLFWAIGFPLMMIIILGLAFTYKKESLKKVAVVCESDCSNHFLVQKIEKNKDWIRNNPKKIQNELINFQFHILSFQEALDFLRQGKVKIIIRYNSNQDITEYHFDAKDEDTKKEYILLKRYMNLPTVYSSTTKEKIEPIQEVGNRYIDFLVPGLMGMVISFSCLWGMAWHLVEMRAKKIMKRVYLTNMSKGHFIRGHLFARIIITSVEVLILYIVAKLLFQVNITGSIIAFFIVFFSGLFCFTGISLLIGSRTDNIKVGEGLVDALALPFVLVSGIFFSYHLFPDFLVPIIQYFPLTIIVDSLRSIFTGGANIMDVLPGCIILNIIGFILSSFALRIYKWY